MTPPERIARRALEHYALGGQPELRLVNISENATFRVDGTVDGRPRAMRVHRTGYHSRAAILSELAWARALRADGIATTPRALAGRDGGLVQEVGGRHVVLFDWEDGTAPAIGDDLTRPFEQLGALAAGLHRHARRWPRPEGFTRLTWDVDTMLGEVRPHWGRWRDGMGVDADLADLFARTATLIRARLGAYGRDAQRFGLIHGDLRLANLLIAEAELKVIDFDDCGFGWFLYDAATPLSFHEDAPEAEGLIEAWVRGYRQIAPLGAADVAEIPTFVMLRRLLLIAWIGSHGETALARSLGAAYTVATGGLCEAFLRRGSGRGAGTAFRVPARI